MSGGRWAAITRGSQQQASGTRAEGKGGGEQAGGGQGEGSEGGGASGQQTPAQVLLEQLRVAGVDVSLDEQGRDLRCKAAAGVLTAGMVAEIRLRKTALLTLIKAETGVRRELQARYDQACAMQTERWGSAEWSWTDRALARIDEATTRCERAIERADRAGFGSALADFLWRSTPIQVLLEDTTAARQEDTSKGDLRQWVACLREWVMRGGQDGKANDLVIDIGDCRALHGEGLKVRVIGQPRTGESEISAVDLPGFVQAVEEGIVGGNLVKFVEAMGVMRRSPLGEGMTIEGFRRAAT